MNYRYHASEEFWKNFYDLSAAQKASARYAWEIFRENPFDPWLKTHKIHALSGRGNKTVYSIWIEDNLRAVFYISGNTVFTVDIGEHDIYR